MKRRALVTGGCGFIGSYLLDLLVERDFDILVVDILFHNNLQNVAHLDGKIELSRTDIRDASALGNVFASFKPHDVFHLAAHHFIPYCNEHPVEALHTNIIGTQNVANVCAAHGVEKLFFASTAAVYGISDHPHVEGEIPNPLDIYGVTKAAGEKIMNFVTRTSKVKVRIGRYFNAVGNRETNPHILPEIVAQLKTSRRGPLKLGNVTPKRDYIHAADLASASYTLVNNPNDEPFDIVNLGSGQEYSVADLVSLFGDTLGADIPIESDPIRVRHNDRPHLCANAAKLHSKYAWAPHHSLQEAISELASTI